MVTSVQIQFIGRAYTNEIIVSGTTKQQIVKTYQWKCQAWRRHFFSEVQRNNSTKNFLFPKFKVADKSHPCFFYLSFTPTNTIAALILFDRGDVNPIFCQIFPRIFPMKLNMLVSRLEVGAQKLSM